MAIHWNTTGQIMIEKFKQEVDAGLRMTPKQLPSKYFYDKKGDALFVEIMKLPEYYLTRAEHDIFKNRTDDLIRLLGFGSDDFLELIELGAGDGTKTVELLRALCGEDYPFEYCPVDFSQNALELLEADLKNKCPKLQINPLRGEYFEVLKNFNGSHHRKVVLFLGSNIGNLRDDRASVFLHELDQTLNVGDRLLLGVDLIKSEEVVLPAYNDSKGVTREFNLNLLRRINRELEADFDLEGFEHRPEYDESTGIAASYLESTQKQNVRINGSVYSFEKGERILTEISRKYNEDILTNILEPTRFRIIDKIMDRDNHFADYVLEIVEKP